MKEKMASTMDSAWSALVELFQTTAVPFLTTIGGKLVFALLVWFVGAKLIKMAVKMLERSKAFGLIEATVRSFTLSFIRIGLNVLLFITIIAILGVPMSSVVAVVASAAAALGLAMQGALSNLAGGLMLLIFRPFEQGDYIEAAGVAGTVREINLFYTVLITFDGKKATVPNGILMNSNIIDYTSEEARRADVTFTCAKTQDLDKLRELMIGVAYRQPKILLNDENRLPSFYIVGNTNNALKASVRVWCKTEDYWDVYFALNSAVSEALNEAGVQEPVVRIASN